MNDWNGFATGLIGGLEEGKRRNEQQELDGKLETARQQLPLADPNARLGLEAMVREVALRKRRLSSAAMTPVVPRGGGFLTSMLNILGNTGPDGLDQWP